MNNVVEDGALVITAPYRAEIRPLPRPDGPLVVRTIYSGVSLGTELSFYTGTNPTLSARLDPVLGLFVPTDTPGYPVTRVGYMEVARVESDTSPLALLPGTRVAMTYGHRTGWAADPLAERVVPLPDDLDPVVGVLVAHMGPICANGLLHAAAEEHGPDVRGLGDGVRGRRVAVIGAGTVGLLTALFARMHGAAEVVVIDPTKRRRDTAERLGLEGLDPDAADPATVLKSRWRHGPGDRGADVVLQCRGQLAALALALRLCRPQTTVIDLAFHTGGGHGDELRLAQEFHHHGLGVRSAQIGRVPRGTDRHWDRERLSAETITLLRAEGTPIRNHLISDILPLDDAPQLFADVADRRRHVLQAVLAV
ncbi:MAG: zinc-binding alcohol dehydrogenase [Pseudonocardiales bacterium]|nr:zinc-binding alcohol dehydrogenase [Pseudonocardiales bacterium]